MSKIDITTPATVLADGMLQTANPLDATLQVVTDNVGNSSKLLLSTTEVQVNSTLRINTDNAEILDIQDTAANNRFNINRSVQKINLDFASMPADLTTQVGTIRTAIDGINLADVVKFQENGQVTFTERVKLESDSTVTTQASAVIQSTTSNANLVIAPNGTGALIANIPDGLVAGGNARGSNAVDLQVVRGSAIQVASASRSVIVGGNSNKATGGDSVVVGGEGNTSSGLQSFIGGGNANTASSSYSTVSGGQSNTASTNTHATVVGGQSNTASGQHSIAGGSQATASGNNSICLTSEGNSSGTQSVSIGRQTFSTGTGSVALGFQANTNSQSYSNVIGGGGKSNNGNENIFANSRRQIGEGILAGGIYQRRHSIIGLNSQTTASTAKYYSTAELAALGNEFVYRVNNIAYSPLFTNVYFKIESEIIFAVNNIIGTATGITIGDYKICKLQGTGRIFGGVSSVISQTLTVVSQSGSMATTSFALGLNGTDFTIVLTNPTFVGGGTLDITTMSDNIISEMKQNI